MKITLPAVGLTLGSALLAIVSAAGAQTKAAAFDKTLLSPATLTAKAPAEYDVKFTTTKGVFVVHVTKAWSPNGADRFYNLVRHHFYDGVAFFRNIKGFMVQFGLSPYPEISKAWVNAKINDDPVKQSNKPGYITFATSGRNSRTTQVFINHGDNANLDGQGFSPFGIVTTGLDIVEQLYDGYGGAPSDGMGQSNITTLGRAWLEKNYPKLDTIKSAVIVSPSAPASTGTKKP